MSKLQELIQKLCPDRVEYSSLGKYIDIYTGIQFNKKDMSEVGTYIETCSTSSEIYNDTSLNLFTYYCLIKFQSIHITI